MSAFRPLAWLLCLGLGFVPAWGASALAQTADGGDKPAKAAATSAESKTAGPKAAQVPSADSVKSDILYLPGPDGDLVPIPKGATLQGYLAWLQKQAAAPATYSISQAALEGSSDDERISLTAKIRVHVIIDDEWVRVPLQMAEAVLRDSAYSGPGEAVADRFSPEQGYAWWFKGSGNHELTLTLSIPLRKQLPGRRFQLSLPATVVSSLKLRVPHPHIIAKVLEKSTLSTHSMDNATEIEVFGLGTRLDLSWQPVADPASSEVLLEASTLMSASLVDGESVTIEASQRIQVLQGRAEEFRIHIPGGFELLRVDGPEYMEHRSDPAQPNQILVKLKKPATGTVDLKWTVRSKLPAMGTPIALEGFEVDRARIQTGYLAVGVVGDFRISKFPEEDRFVQRVNLSDLPPALRQSQVTAGYRFLNQPFRLTLLLQKVQPYFTAEPHLFLHIAPDHLELEGVFLFQVFRGSVSEVRLNWPGWKAENWVIEPIGPVGRVEETLMDDSANPGIIRVRLVEPAKGSFELRLRARRAIDRGQGAIPLSLPNAEASSPSPAALDVSLADNIELEFQPTEATQFRQLSSPSSAKVSPPKDFQKYRHLQYRLESVQRTFMAAIKLHPQQIKTEAEIKAALNRGLIAVRQRVLYDVAYERLSQVKLLVDVGLRDEQVKFFAQSGVELVPTWTPPVEAGMREVNLTLDQPRIGRFEVEVRYTIDQPQSAATDESAPVIIPLFQSVDATFSSMRFEWQETAEREAAVTDENWTRRSPAEGFPYWTADGTKPAVRVKLLQSARTATRGLMVSKALIRTVLDREGVPQSRAQFRIAGPGIYLPMKFPPGVVPTAFWWDRQRLTAATAAESADGSHVHQIKLPERSGVREHLLTIDFRSPSHSPVRFVDDYQLQAPQFPDEVFTTQTLWEVVLPGNQHLFTDPRDFSQEFRWSFKTFFWGRVPYRSPEKLAEWIGATDGPEELSLLASGNTYLFSHLGPPTEIVLGTMTQAGIVLIGAGLALIVGLMLVRIPATRHALTFLLLGFFLALLGLWFPGPVLLLLQPAGLGLFLAVGAAAIDGLLKRRRQASVVTLTSPSGFMTAPSSANRQPAVIGVGSEEFTFVRPPAPPPSSATVDVVRTTESGSRA